MLNPVLIRENRVISILRDISTPVRFIISALGVTALVLIWFFALYLPASNQIQKFKSDMNLLQKDIGAFTVLASQAPNLESEHQVLDSKLKNQIIVTEENAVSFLMETIKAKHLNLIKFIPKKDLFILSASGAYPDIVSFIDTINSMHIRNFSLVSSRKNTVQLTIHLGIKND